MRNPNARSQYSSRKVGVALHRPKLPFVALRMAVPSHHGAQHGNVLAAGNVASSSCSPSLRAAPGALLPSAARVAHGKPWVMGEGCLRRGLPARDCVANWNATERHLRCHWASNVTPCRIGSADHDPCRHVFRPPLFLESIQSRAQCRENWTPRDTSKKLGESEDHCFWAKC